MTREIRPGTAPGRGGSIAGQRQPPFSASVEQREKVMALVACGFNHQQIAASLGIPLRSLRRHFREELVTGKLRVHLEIANGIVEAARAGTSMRIHGKRDFWCTRGACLGAGG